MMLPSFDLIDSVISLLQIRLRKKMAHLVLVSETSADAEITESEAEQEPEEHRPLLRAQGETGCSGSTGLKDITTSYSLIPEASLPAQVRPRLRTQRYSFVTIRIFTTVLKCLMWLSHFVDFRRFCFT